MRGDTQEIVSARYSAVKDDPFALPRRAPVRSGKVAQYVAIALLTLIVTLQVVQAWKGPPGANLRYVAVARDFKDFYYAGGDARRR